MSEAAALRDLTHACGAAGSRWNDLANRVADRLKTRSLRDKVVWADADAFGVRLEQRFGDRRDVPLCYAAEARVEADSRWRVDVTVTPPGGPPQYAMPPVTVRTTADVCRTFRTGVWTIEAKILSDHFLRAAFPGCELVPPDRPSVDRLDSPKALTAGVPLADARPVFAAVKHATDRLEEACALLAGRCQIQSITRSSGIYDGGFEARTWQPFPGVYDTDLLTVVELDHDEETIWSARAGIGFEWGCGKYSGGATDWEYAWEHHKPMLTTFAAIADELRLAADELLVQAGRIDLKPPAHRPRTKD